MAVASAYGGEMRIEDVDPADDAALEAFHAHEARVAAADPHDVVWTLDEMRVRARTRDPWVERTFVWARDDDGAVVATAQLERPLRDNTDTATVDLRIDPRRRADAGSFLDHLAHRVRLAGRSRLEVGARWSPDETASPDAELLRVHGFRLGLVTSQRVLDLPADDEHLVRLAERSAPHHTAYVLRTWCGPVPEDVLDAYAGLRSLMRVEAPSGDLGWEPEDFPPSRVREEERRLAEQRRTSITTVAVAADGTVVGHTQIVVPGTDPVNAFQWDTLVLASHRGHRLGIGMKVQNLRRAGAELGERSLLHTWNAADNAPMVAVNEAMGFRLVAYDGVFSRAL